MRFTPTNSARRRKGQANSWAHWPKRILILPVIAAVFIVAAFVDLLVRWAQDAFAYFWSSRGYAIVSILAAVYVFLYSLANDAYQRAELNASTKLSTFVTLASSGNKLSFVAAMKDFASFQMAESVSPPGLNPLTWNQTTFPNQLFLNDWARVVLAACDEKECGGGGHRINLSAARLEGAQLRRIDFRRSNLVFARLSRANLLLSNFEDAHLPHALISGAILMNARFQRAKLPCASLEAVYATTSFFIDADLRGVKAAEGDFRHADFSGAHLEPVRCPLPPADVPDINQESEEAMFSLMSASSFEGGKLGGAKFKGAKLRHVNFKGADLSGSDLSGADMTGADLENAILSGATYNSSTVWPKGFDPAKRGAREVRR